MPTEKKYPIKSPSSAPATGRLFYEFLMRNIATPASANHEIWHKSQAAKLEEPSKWAFRRDIPTGQELGLVALAGQPLSAHAGKLYMFTGDESYVLVSDLTDDARQKLGIPASARGADKVYNANFKPFGELPELTRVSNELAALSVPKSISSFLAGNRKKVNYSEKDALDFLVASLSDLSGPEMMHILHGNHLAWAALAYIREHGNIEGDIMAEFHGQNPTDFYMKDMGTVLPTIFFALANLGTNPVEKWEAMDTKVWGAHEAAEYMRKFMPTG